MHDLASRNGSEPHVAARNRSDQARPLTNWSARTRRLARQRFADERRARELSVGPVNGAPEGLQDQRDNLDVRLNKLQDAVNVASAHTRNVYVTFLLFGLYLAVIFGSTTHEQLLRGSPVALPLLNVGLPLVGFYWVAPALFLLLHLNLLLQLYLLFGKLHRLDRALEEALSQNHLDQKRADDWRAQLYPFPFSQMLVGRQHGRLMRFLLRLVVWLTVLVLPIVLLLMGQVQFLPYHDAWITMWFRLLVAADLILIVIFWRAIHHPTDSLLSRPGRWIWDQAKVALPALGVLVLSFLVLTFPGDYATGDRASPSEAPPDFGDPMEEALFDDHGWLARVYPTSWRVVVASLSWGPKFRIFWPTQVLFDSFPFLQRKLVVREVNLVARWPTQGQIDQFGEELAWQNFGAPPDLRGRDLRYAELSQSIFVRGDFRDASLEGATLSNANFTGANLRSANLQRAVLESANLRRAVLELANLQRATMGYADLQGANLNIAKLQRAIMSNADLRGASLWGAKLQRASLRRADLQGADLREADLQGAALDDANLRSTNLRTANFQGAILKNATLSGGDLRNARLQGAIMLGAVLRGANLQDAHLWRALLDREADLSSRWELADLRGVDVDPIKDLDVWIERAGGATDLREAVRDDNRPDVPRFPEAWRLAPSIMFYPSDSVPEMLGWGTTPWETVDAYDEDLASFLGRLACTDDEAVHVVRVLADRALLDGAAFNRLYAQRLASHLVGDVCPPAAVLSGDILRQLKQLATRDARHP